MRELALLAAGLAAVLVAMPAHAAPRTWVSSTGSGATCSRSAPCADFATAYNATDDGGEINCADSVLYGGTLFIGKSITIDCTGTNAVLAGGPVTIAMDAAGANLTLRGLEIVGTASATVGVLINNANEVHIENCRISGFQFAGGNLEFTGVGIVLWAGVNNPGSADHLYVSDTIIENNGNAGHGAGILISAREINMTVRATLNRVQFVNNWNGIRVDGTDFGQNLGSGSLVVQVRDSVVTGSAGNGIWAIGGVFSAGIVVDRTSVLGNAGSGVLAQGGNGLVHIGNSTVIGNGTGLNAASGGRIFSYGNNQASGNFVDGAPTGMLTAK